MASSFEQLQTIKHLTQGRTEIGQRLLVGYKSHSEVLRSGKWVTLNQEIVYWLMSERQNTIENNLVDSLKLSVARKNIPSFTGDNIVAISLDSPTLDSINYEELLDALGLGLSSSISQVSLFFSGR